MSGLMKQSLRLEGRKLRNTSRIYLSSTPSIFDNNNGLNGELHKDYISGAQH